MRMTLPPLKPTWLPRRARRSITSPRSLRASDVSEVSCTAVLVLGIAWKALTSSWPVFSPGAGGWAWLGTAACAANMNKTTIRMAVSPPVRPSGRRSAPAGLVPVEQALQRLEMQLGELAIVGDLPVRALGQRLVDIVQRPAGLHGQHLHHRGALEIVEVVVGSGDGRAAHDHAVIAQEQDVLVGQRPAHAVAFLGRQGHAGIGLVIGDAVPVAEGVLGAHLDAAALERGQCRGVGLLGGPDHVGALVALL